MNGLWRHRRASLRIRHLLVGLSLLALAPMALFAGFLLSRQWQAQQEQLRRDLRTITQAVAANLDHELNSTARQLQRVAESPSLQSPSLDLFLTYMRRLAAERGDWDHLVLARPDGTTVLDTRRPALANPPANAAAAPAADDERQEFWTSGVFIDPVDGVPAVTVSIALRQPGFEGWLLRARLTPAYLQSLALFGGRNSGRVVSVVDESGHILSRNREFTRLFGTPGSASYLSLIRSAPAGMSHSTSAEGRSLVVSWRRLDNGWTVGVGMDPALFDSPLRISPGVLAAGAALLLLTVSLALLLARRIARQVGAAASDAQDLARGREPWRRRSAIREIDSLFGSLHRAGSQLAQTGRERNEAMRQAQAELQRRDRFLSLLAHELRNPLAPITQAAWLLDRSPGLEERDRRRAGVIAKQARQLTRLVDDLLETSRLTHDKVRLQAQDFSLCGLVLDTLEAAQPGFTAAGQHLSWLLPGDPVHWHGDPQRIAQVLHNLLSNAAKFVPAGGHVQLRLVTDERDIRLELADDGPGLDPRHLEDIFQPFSQMHQDAARSQGGLGLGLPISRELVRLHGGTLHAESAGPGRGMKFVMSLPKQSAQS